MQEIRAVLSKYCVRDIYNGDGTAYCWWMQPDRDLSTQRLAGKKKDKARVTVMITASGNGSEREPFWTIRTTGGPGVLYFCYRLIF